MIDVEKDTQKLKQYYDSLAGYQRLFIRLFVSSKLDEALSKPSIDALQVCVDFREIKSAYTRLFSGLSVFAKSETFEFYTQAFDTLLAFGIKTSQDEFDKLLANQARGIDPFVSVQRIDQLLANLDKTGKLLELDDAQHVFDVFADNPPQDANQAGCCLLLNKANILTRTNRRDIEHDPKQGVLEESLTILYEDGLLRDDDAQRAFDLFMSSYKNSERLEGASLLKELTRAGLLGDKVAQSNHAGARLGDQASICQILKILNDRTCPVTQERFEKIMKLPPNVMSVLIEDGKQYSTEDCATFLLWTERYFDKAIDYLSRIDANPIWQGRDYLVNALCNYKLDIRHAESKSVMDALQQHGLFKAGETAIDSQHTPKIAEEPPSPHSLH
jgi:hypothetical protein